MTFDHANLDTFNDKFSFTKDHSNISNLSLETDLFLFSSSDVVSGSSSSIRLYRSDLCFKRLA